MHMTCLEKYQTATKIYLSNLQSTGVSATTITNYQRRLTAFYRFWSSSSPTTDPTTTDFRNWRDAMIEDGLKTTSIKQYLSELRYFYDFCCDEELGEEKIYSRNPVLKRIIPKVKAKPYEELLNPSQVASLFVNQCRSHRRGDLWPRNYAIVVLLLTTGIRNSELLNLDLADCHFDYGEIIIRNGKGDKYRVIDFPDIAQSAIKLYLSSAIRPQTAKESEPLFGTTAEQKKGGKAKGGSWHRGTSQWLSSVVERHVAAVTGIHNIRTHDLRHICARIDLTSGVGMALLQGKLGHSNPNTTQIYSGRLTASRQMTDTSSVLKERDKQAEYNEQLLIQHCS